ncbi:MAG: hypothetical protein AAFV19_10095 [Pseudomonadota bacterium]
MDTHRVIRTLFLASLALLVAQSDATAQPLEQSFCIDPPHDRLCPVFPEDQTDFSRFFEYRVVNDTAQAPFDTYAWQAFVALNWADLERSTASENWRHYARKQDVLGSGLGLCANHADAQESVVATPFQSDGTQLIDQSGNFIVYETRLNTTAETYLREHNLVTTAGRAAFGRPISFPQGNLNGQAAPALLKFAWQIMPEPTSDMIRARGLIPIQANQDLDAAGRCLAVDLGLIGMHIVTKVESGHGDKWIWATFEHRENAPTAANAREINSLYANALFPDGCAGPKDGIEQAYRLFDPSCPDCARNMPPSDTLYWAEEPPYAATATGAPAEPSQIVRCWKVFGPTQQTNLAWQKQLTGTPLEHYMLISSQWRGANPDPIFPNGELPRYLSNVAMETYIQTDPQGTCLGCHANARTSEGAPSDFTFLLR